MDGPAFTGSFWQSEGQVRELESLQMHAQFVIQLAHAHATPRRGVQQIVSHDAELDGVIGQFVEEIRNPFITQVNSHLLGFFREHEAA